MKKKLVSALLCTAMVTSMIAGCGSTGGNESDNNGGTEANSEETGS